MRVNLHNHTLCSDGLLLPIQIIEEAHSQGLDLVAITDHILTSPHPIRTVVGDLTGEPHLAMIDQFVRPLPKPPAEAPDIVGLPITIPTYQTALRTLSANYKGKIQVLVGGEIHFPANVQTLANHSQQLAKFDMLMVEHVTESNFDAFIEFRRTLSIPVGLAHTNIQKVFPTTDLDQLRNALILEKVFVEFNTSYPEHFRENRPFFEGSRGSRLNFSIGTDTHHMLGHMRDIHIAERFVDELGLADNFLFWKDLARSDDELTFGSM